MKNLIALALLCSLTLVNQLAYADSPSFSYVELEYIAAGDFEISDGSLSVDVDLDGYALTGSLELGIFFIQASRFELETDQVLSSSLEDSISTIALGLTFALPKTSIYGLVRGRRDELSLRGGGFDEDEEGTTVGAEIGARVNLTDRIEVNANIGRPALDEGSSFGIGAQFFVTKNFGITLDFNSIEVEDDNIRAKFDTSSIGVRYSF